MKMTGFEAGDQVRIFRDNNPSLNETTTYTYAPGTGCSSTVIPALPGCCDWTPCPELNRTTYVIPGWNPLDRDITAPTTDRIGVEIEYTHQWVTGLFASTTQFDRTTVFQVEPQLFDVS
jgi:hypothetical protein